MAHLKTLATIYYNMLGQKQHLPRIRHAPPIRGERELLCKTDEASVSRMRSPKRYAGMVERLQKPAESDRLLEMSFGLTVARESGEGAYDISPEFSANFILRFLALRLARSIHPENFVNVRELRISGRCGWPAGATYSDFVPDETGVMARRAEFSRRFYSSDFQADRVAIQLESNAVEHDSNPALANFARIMELSGISVPHPEANYHMAGKRTVFFEVLGVDVHKAFSAAVRFSPEPEESLALISTICAVMFSHYNRMNPKNAYLLARSFGNFGFEDTSRIIYNILSYAAARKARCDLNEGGMGLFSELHSSMQFTYAMALALPWKSESGMPRNGWPVAIDPRLL